MFNKLKAKAQEAQGQISEKGQEALAKVAADVEVLRPLLKRCGFLIDEIVLRITIPPAIVITLEDTGEFDDEALAELAKLKEEGKSQAQKVVAVMALQATEARKRMLKTKFRTKTVSAEMSVPPVVEIAVRPATQEELKKEGQA